MNKIENTFNFDSYLNFDADLDLSPIDFSMDESAQNAESKNDSAPSTVELTDEIKSFRQKNHEFQATNDHETYLIVCFSLQRDAVGCVIRAHDGPGDRIVVNKKPRFRPLKPKV